MNDHGGKEKTEDTEEGSNGDLKMGERPAKMPNAMRCKLMLGVLLTSAICCSGQEEPKMTEAMKEEVAFAAIESRLNAKDYAAVEAQAKAFLDRETGFAKSRKTALVSYYLGFALEHQGKTDDAIAQYSRTVITRRGAIHATATAMKRFMQLMWERNQPARENIPSDRQTACTAGKNYIDHTAPLVDRMNDADRAAWNELKPLVEQYVADLSATQP